MKRIVLLLFSMAILGCGTTSGVRRSFEHHQHSMNYLFDSVENVEKKNMLIYLNDIKFSAGNLPDSFVVEKEKRYFIPLIFLNYWKGVYLCKLGKKNIYEDLDNFISSSFRSEVERSGRFQLTDDVNADYQLDLEFSNIISEGIYTQSGKFHYLIFLYMWGSSQSTSSIHASILSNVKLSRNDEIVFEKDVSIKKTQYPMSTSSMTAAELKYNFAIQLVENLSLCFKECFEDIVAELNNCVDLIKVNNQQNRFLTKDSEID